MAASITHTKQSTVETPIDRLEVKFFPPVQSSRMRPSPRLEKLPVELLYEIELYALSESLTVLNKHLHHAFDCTHSSYRAEYIFLRYLTRVSPLYTHGELITYALTFPLCTEDVLDGLLRIMGSERYPVEEGPRPELPKRIFRNLHPLAPSLEQYSAMDFPLPFLRYLYTHQQIRDPDANAHDGYALVRAVHAGHLPLIRFLLRHGAKPGLKEALALRIAIKKKNLGIVRMLVEREAEEEYEEIYYVPPSADEASRSGSDPFERDGVGVDVKIRKRKRKSAKRRRVEDRVEVTTAMLRVAVETDARDIVQFFLDKGARPDLLTIQRMRRIGFV